jgi:hypothetical protein
MSRVALIGTGNSKLEAPFGESRWEFWGLNNLYKYIPFNRWTRWFELHKFSVDEKTNMVLRKGYAEFRGMLIADYLEDLKELDISIYMREDCQIIAGAKKFPVSEVTNELGRYFTSTNAWMLGLAICMDFDTIGIYGFDMMTGEYAPQRPCAEYLIGYARGQGKQVILPSSCPLCKCDKMYGIGDN